MPGRLDLIDFQLDSFYRQLGRSRQRLLMCDYDGTLAPFCTDRSAATPYPGVREVLRAINRTQQTRVVIVSGRDVRQVEELLALDEPVEIWGCHGWQRQRVGQPLEQMALPPAATTALHRARECAPWPQEQLEVKPVSLALHWRGLPEKMALQMEVEVNRLWGPLVAEGGLELHRFDGGVELRCPARTKGDVVRQLLQEGQYDVSAYLGDDRTDEDAFRALKGRGLPILVHENCRDTAADLRLAPPVELLQFLAHWHLLTG